MDVIRAMYRIILHKHMCRYGDDSEIPLTPLVEWEAIEKQAPKARWPTRFQRKLALMEEGVSREKLEKSERDREVGALATALTAA